MLEKPTGRGLVAPFKERRRSPRVSTEGHLRATVAGLDEVVQVLDLSLGGFAMEAVEALEIGSTYEFQFELTSRSTIALRGKVLYRRRDQDQRGRTHEVLGVRFVDETDEDSAAAIGRLMDQLAIALAFDGDEPA